MKTGIFVLTKTITNPKPDRRKTHDWTAQTEWTPGMRFCIREEPLRAVEASVKHTAAKVFELTALGVQTYPERIGFVVRDNEAPKIIGYSPTLETAYWSLVEALVPSTERDGALLWVSLRRNGVGAYHSMMSRALIQLVRSGEVSIAQVERALDIDDAEDAP